MDVVDQAVIQTLFNKESNQEVFNYINKYRQLISQVIQIFKQIDLKSWGNVKNLLRRLKILKLFPTPKFSLNIIKFKERLQKFNYKYEKLKTYMPKFSETIETIQKRMNSLGINEDKLNKARNAMADAMYMMSKAYSIFTYANSILKGTVFSQKLKQKESTNLKSSAL